MNKKVKILLTILMIGLTLVTFSTSVFALEKPSELKDKIAAPADADTNLTTTGGQILGIIKIIGIVLSVGVLMVLGIKYMMGSAQEKAEYKKVFIPYIVGAGLLFAASLFADTIYGFFANMG